MHPWDSVVSSLEQEEKTLMLRSASILAKRSHQDPEWEDSINTKSCTLDWVCWFTKSKLILEREIYLHLDTTLYQYTNPHSCGHVQNKISRHSEPLVWILSIAISLTILMAEGSRSRYSFLCSACCCFYINRILKEARS